MFDSRWTLETGVTEGTVLFLLSWIAMYQIVRMFSALYCFELDISKSELYRLILRLNRSQR